MTLAQMLVRQAKEIPYHKAIIFEKQKISYKELNLLANQLAHGLINSGLGKGSKVAMLLHNCPEFIITYFAALKIGATIVPLNTFLTSAEIKFILDDCSADILVTSTDFQKRVVEIAALDFARPVLWLNNPPSGKNHLSWKDVLVKEGRDNPEVTIDHQQAAAILYTSGTTGHPKGVMLSHQNLLSNIDSCLKAVEVLPNDRFLLFLPMFHAFSFTVCVLLPIMAGARIIVLTSARPFSKVIKSIIFGRVTIFAGIPQVYNILASAKLPWFFKYINPIRLCISGAAPLSAEVLKKFEEHLKIPLLEGYGLTETSPAISFNPPKGIRKPGSVGLPLPGIEVKIVDEEEKELPINQVGEIIIKGKNVMLGYYNLPEATNQTIRGGWLFTGDMGKTDEDGYLYIVDRKKDMIISRGMNIYPREIEEVLYTHPKIAEAAVIGKKDTHRGEVPIAIVTLKKGQTEVAPPAEIAPRADAEKEIIQFCQQKLATFKVPKMVEFWDELPKTPTGKILKREIKRIQAENEKWCQ